MTTTPSIEVLYFLKPCPACKKPMVPTKKDFSGWRSGPIFKYWECRDDACNEGQWAEWQKKLDAEYE